MAGKEAEEVGVVGVVAEPLGLLPNGGENPPGEEGGVLRSEARGVQKLAGDTEPALLRLASSDEDTGAPAAEGLEEFGQAGALLLRGEGSRAVGIAGDGLEVVPDEEAGGLLQVGNELVPLLVGRGAGRSPYR